jgi:HlyD family secretion protein
MAMNLKRTKPLRFAVITGLVLLALLAIGVRAKMGPKVAVTRAERRPLVQKIVANGRVDVPVRVQLGAQAGGVVARMLADHGDLVRAGDLLAELANDEAAAVVAQASARLQQVRELDLPAAQEELRQAEVSLRGAERQLERTQTLAVGDGVSAEEVESARDARDLALSRRDNAAARVRGHAAGGSLERLAVAQLAAAQARLEQTRVVAPAPGLILQRLAQPGDIVAAGTALLDLAPEGPTWLVVQPEEKNLAFLRVGQAAQVSADAYPDSLFTARITRLAPAVDPARGTIEVELMVDEPPTFLRPDMTVSIDVEVARNASALVLPGELVRDADGSPWVLVVRGGRAERQAVALGLRGQGMVEIASGLGEGDAVVSPEAVRIRAGSRVRAAAGTP